MNSEHMKKRAAQHLLLAIAVMRDACDMAQQEAATGDGFACQRVLHRLAWAFANASSGIETAMAQVETAHELDKFAEKVNA